MELVNKQNGNLDSLYNVYSSQVGTNKIIQFEADFVSGDRSGSLRQFSDVEIRPFENIIVNVIDIEKYKKGTVRKAYFVDASLSRINQEMRLNGNLVFIVDHIREEGYNSLITGDEEIEDRDVQLLYEGISQLEICNYQKAESAFNTLILNDKLKRYAILNLVAVQCAKAELVLSDNDFSSSVYINDKRVDRKKYDNQIKPDYAIPEKTLNDYLMTAPKDGFAWYNLGNVHLKEKNFEKALNDYTLAVKYEPTLAEAYYNKGLVLLFIGRGAEARPMLSKAGELGIDEAYAVMKRYL